MLHELIEGESQRTQEYLRKIVDGADKNMHLIEEGCYRVGKAISDGLTKGELDALAAMGIILCGINVQRFGHILLYGTSYYSKWYTRARKGTRSRRNDICAYFSEGRVNYGTILSFCTLPHPHSSICFIKKYNLTNISPISCIRPPRHQEMESKHTIVQNILSTRILGVKKSSTVAATTLCNIKQKCIKIPPVLKNGTAYIIPLPNNYEVH